MAHRFSFSSSGPPRRPTRKEAVAMTWPRLKLIILATVAILVALVVSPDVASAAPAQAYGAMAFAPSLQRFDAQVQPYGFASSATRAKARTRSLTNCRQQAAASTWYDGDCQQTVWVRNGFVAVTYTHTENGAWGSGWGHTRAIAVSHSKRICSNFNDGAACLGTTASAR